MPRVDDVVTEPDPDFALSFSEHQEAVRLYAERLSGLLASPDRSHRWAALNALETAAFALKVPLYRAGLGPYP